MTQLAPTPSRRSSRCSTRRTRQHALWVTLFRDGELFAGGDYPNQGPAGEGLPKYIADHANIEARTWWSGSPRRITHHARVEDYPVMTPRDVGFSLLPDGFFDQNAALDAP